MPPTLSSKTSSTPAPPKPLSTLLNSSLSLDWASDNAKPKSRRMLISKAIKSLWLLPIHANCYSLMTARHKWKSKNLIKKYFHKRSFAVFSHRAFERQPHATAPSCHTTQHHIHLALSSVRRVLTPPIHTVCSHHLWRNTTRWSTNHRVVLHILVANYKSLTISAKVLILKLHLQV